MGRGFSTFYHTIMVIMSISALVLTIMSATSCSFVKFDHQYKGDGTRMLVAVQSDYNDRLLQSEEEGQDEEDVFVQDTAEDIAWLPDDSVTAGGEPAIGVDELPPDDVTVTVDETTEFEEDPIVPDDISVPEVDLSIPPADVSAPSLGDMALTENSSDMDDGSPMGVAGQGDGLAKPFDGQAVGSTNSSSTGDVSGTGMRPDSTSDQVVEEPIVNDPSGVAGQGDGLAKPYDGPVGSTNSSGTGDVSGTGMRPGSTSDQVDNSTYKEPYGAASDNTASSMEKEAVGAVSGTAGLFCEAEKSFSVGNLWRGSMEELEDEIALESEMNQSEELARYFAIVATLFSFTASTVLVIESVLGWRICCEKWIISLVALLACVSQGITFLFFNSERYCDGDIINEILNQEPCVLGQGGVYSIVAITLYAIMVVMACRLPQDDPYGLCCKKNRDAKDSTATFKGSSSGFGLLGGKSENGDDGNPANGKPEKPNWLSEESKPTIDEENEII